MRELQSNESGIIPVSTGLVVKPDEVSDRAGESGIIFVPVTAMQREQEAQTIGTVLSVGPDAFEADTEPKPKVGDRVVFKKYAGFSVQNPDTRQKYQIILDKDVVGILCF